MCSMHFPGSRLRSDSGVVTDAGRKSRNCYQIILACDGFRGYFDFFSLPPTHGVCQERDDFVVVVTGANPAVAEAPQFEGRDNPVFHFFREVYLHLLDQTECVDMVRTLGRGMGIKFTEEAAHRVHHLTGGHPFFARQLCSFVAKRHVERPLRVDEKTIVSLLETCMLSWQGKDFGEILDRLRRDFPDELEVLLKLAAADEALPLAGTQSPRWCRHSAPGGLPACDRA